MIIKTFPVSRRKFVKTAGILTTGFALFGPKYLFARSLEEEMVVVYDYAKKQFAGNLDAAWLSLAYSLNLTTNFSESEKKIRRFIKDNRSHYNNTTLAILSVAYAMSGFDDDVVNIHREATKESRGDISGAWLTMASVQNKNKTLFELYGCLNYDEPNITTSMVSLAYSASGLDTSIKKLYFKANDVTVGNINGSWVTLAYVAGDALYNETKQKKLENFFIDNKHNGTITSSMLTLAYAINNYEDVMPQYYKYKNKTRGDINGALLTIAYAVAKNPNNKISPRFRGS